MVKIESERIDREMLDFYENENWERTLLYFKNYFIVENRHLA
jgi:hypothetical protein